MGELDRVLNPIVEYIFLAVIVSALIYGVISWCILKKFRNYMNYVCLNLLLAQFLVVLCRKYALVSVTAVIIGIYVILVRGHWLVVVCHMFYIDIAKVFDGHMPKRRFLKSFLFGWVVPVLSTIPILFTLSNIVDSIILLSPLILNIILFIIIVCSLCRKSEASATTATSKCRRLYIATLIFIVGDVSLIAYFLIGFILSESYVRPYIYILMLSPILLSVFLVVVKSNRELWHQYYVNKLKQRVSIRREDRNMHERVIGEPAESPAQVLDAQV
ncbi:hypothetical protein PYW08_011417 [Mythimna loreyi]|uniref:Uncharacterized protein n=1 Tax=Mythimna loreyi TaxID=667449 RepID=A0ACC2Q3W3_9NEOP|nr:hypothetical protein PYW08_011417 [Mythimna loreyi]